MRFSLAIWWLSAFILALIWERIIKAEPPMSYGRITDGNYMSWDEYLAAIESIPWRDRLRERESYSPHKLYKGTSGTCDLVLGAIFAQDTCDEWTKKTGANHSD